MSVLNHTQNKLHHLALTLAAFSNSYLEKEDDDSQSNLDWSVEKEALISRTYNNIHLELSFKNLSLKMLNSGTATELDVLGLNRNDIDIWVKEQLKSAGINNSLFNYELGFDLDSDYDNFIDLDKATEDSITQLIEHRNFSQKGLDLIAENNKTVTEIRVWPHHFDTGMLIDLSTQKDMSTGLGLGYAIADSVSESPYYYCYGWGETIDYNDLNPLKNGTWMNADWKGALFPANNSKDLEMVVNFYQEASTALTSKLT